MDFREFERRAREAWEEIPEAFRDGVDGLTVRRSAPEHPDHPGVYTLGECLTEEHASDYGSAETTRSLIAIYWGSFRALAEQDEDFDWDDELWETLTHELRHHLESLAGDDALGDVDRAADHTFRRMEGGDFDPWYYQKGEEVERGVYRVEREWYLEQSWDPQTFARADHIDVEWDGRRWRIERPDELGDVHYVAIHGLPADGAHVELVLLSRRSWWGALRRLFGLEEVVVLESEAEAEPVADEG